MHEATPWWQNIKIFVSNNSKAIVHNFVSKSTNLFIYISIILFMILTSVFFRSLNLAGLGMMQNQENDAYKLFFFIFLVYLLISSLLYVINFYQIQVSWPFRAERGSPRHFFLAKGHFLTDRGFIRFSKWRREPLRNFSQGLPPEAFIISNA